jgi:hypothetical protein
MTGPARQVLSECHEKSVCGNYTYVSDATSRHTRGGTAEHEHLDEATLDRLLGRSSKVSESSSGGSVRARAVALTSGNC